jgi:hypothetical protein
VDFTDISEWYMKSALLFRFKDPLKQFADLSSVPLGTQYSHTLESFVHQPQPFQDDHLTILQMWLIGVILFVTGTQHKVIVSSDLANC